MIEVNERIDPTIPDLSSLMGRGYLMFQSLSTSVVLFNEESNTVYKSHLIAQPSEIRDKNELTFDSKKNRYKLHQHLFLEGIKVLIPKIIGADKSFSVIAMEYVPHRLLMDKIVSGDITGSDFETVGANIAKVHNLLSENSDYIYENFQTNHNDTAHCALKFKNKFESKANDFKNSDQMERNIGKAITILEENIQSYLDCSDPIFGDLKPDNMFFVDNRNVLLIDPILCMGKRSCDLGKFISRLALLNPGIYRKFCNQLLNAYASSAQLDEIETAHMAVFDMLNILTRYISIGTHDREGLPRTINLAIKNFDEVMETIVPKLLLGRL